MPRFVAPQGLTLGEIASPIPGSKGRGETRETLEKPINYRDRSGHYVVTIHWENKPVAFDCIGRVVPGRASPGRFQAHGVTPVDDMDLPVGVVGSLDRGQVYSAIYAALVTAVSPLEAPIFEHDIIDLNDLGLEATVVW